MQLWNINKKRFVYLFSESCHCHFDITHTLERTLNSVFNIQTWWLLLDCEWRYWSVMNFFLYNFQTSVQSQFKEKPLLWFRGTHPKTCLMLMFCTCEYITNTISAFSAKLKCFRVDFFPWTARIHAQHKRDWCPVCFDGAWFIVGAEIKLLY